MKTMKKIFLICIIIFSANAVTCYENTYYRKKDALQGNFLYIIPLNDECIDRKTEEKLYLKNGYLENSDGRFSLLTSSYGLLNLKNISKDGYGYYISKIKMVIKDFHQNENLQLVQPCEWNDEVNGHVADGIEHSIEAFAGIGTAIVSGGVNPITSAAAAAAGAICAEKAIRDFQQAWDCYHDNEQDQDSSKDSSGKNDVDSWDRP